MGGPTVEALTSNFSKLDPWATVFVITLITVAYWINSFTSGIVDKLPELITAFNGFTIEMQKLNNNLKTLGDGPVAMQLEDVNENLKRHADSANKIAVEINKHEAAISAYQKSFGTIGKMIRDLEGHQQESASHLRNISEQFESLPNAIIDEAITRFPNKSDRERFNTEPFDTGSKIYPDDDFTYMEGLM